MRILLVHNFYGSSAPSGENRIVIEERDLLRSAGHEVIEHFTFSDTVRDRGLIPLLRAGLGVPWNPRSRAVLGCRLGELRPDVMHVHNVFPLLSPSIFGAATGTATAVVCTLHNYRTLCPNAQPLRNGAACTECIERRSVLPALRHGCYRGSWSATVPLAACVALHRHLGTYQREVQAFITFTGFQKSLLVRGGLPAERIHLKPNCLAASVQCLPWANREDKCLFVGRISAEKGAHILIEAWSRWGASAPRLEVIGDGSDLESLRHRLPSDAAARVSFLGMLSPEETQARLAKAKLLIIPSTCFEGFPLALTEALGYGVPIAASRLGALEELIDGSGVGRLFVAGNPDSLREVVSSLWADQTELESMSRSASAAAQERYSATANIAALQRIYGQAIAARGQADASASSRTPSVTDPKNL